MGQLSVGAGKAKIVFPEEYYPQYEGFLGVHDEIYLRVLLFEKVSDPGDHTQTEEQKKKLRFVLISAELPSIRPFELIDGLRSFTGRLLDVEPEKIWFAVTHNCSAPHVPDAGQFTEGMQMHMRAVREALEEACMQARRTIRPARFGAGAGVCDVNGNRDMPTREGWWLGINIPGPTDRTVTVLQFEDEEKKPIAILFHYAVKTEVVGNEIMSDGGRYVTGDLTGAACRFVEEQTGAIAVYMMGAAGDQAPRKAARYWAADADGVMTEVHHYEKGFDWAQELGEELGNCVRRAAEEISCDEADPEMRMIHVSIPFRGQYAAPEQVRNRPQMSYEFLMKSDTILDIELLQIGNCALLGVKPEYTCITGIQLRDVSPYTHTMIAAMVNGGQGYMPDYRAYERFTYEAMSSEYACGGAEHFVEIAGDLLVQLSGGSTV